MRIILLFLFGGLLILVVAMVIKTLSFTSHQLFIAPARKRPISDAVLQHLSDAVRIPTASHLGTVDTMAFNDLDSLIRVSFPLVDSLLEKTTVNTFSSIYKWQGKNPNLQPILIMAHKDVVPATVEHWTYPPFNGTLKDGFIWGRGTMDDKMNIFAILEATEMLLAKNFLPERSIYFAFGHDEEVGGMAGAKKIAEKFEREGIHFDYALDEGLMILENALPGMDKPLAMIGIAEKGYATLTLSVNLEESGHSSMPPAETAIGILSKAISTLQENPFPAKIDGAVAKLFDFSAPEMDVFYRVIFANRWLTAPLLKAQLSKSHSTNAMLRTTMAPTIINGGTAENVLPNAAEAKINFRIIQGETTATVIDYIKKTINDDRITISQPKKGFTSEPSEVSDTEAFGFQVIHKTIRQIFPETVVAPGLLIAGTDSRYYSRVADNTYRFIPFVLKKDDLKRFHGIDERISAEAYKDMIRFYRLLLLNSGR